MFINHHAKFVLEDHTNVYRSIHLVGQNNVMSFRSNISDDIFRHQGETIYRVLASSAPGGTIYRVLLVGYVTRGNHLPSTACRLRHQGKPFTEYCL